MNLHEADDVDVFSRVGIVLKRVVRKISMSRDLVFELEPISV